MTLKLETEQAPKIQNNLLPEKPKEASLPKETLLELAKPQFHRWVLALIGDWSVMILAMIIATQIHHFIAYLAAIFVIGTRQHAIGLLGHEGAHKIVSRNRRLGDTLTQVFCFWPLVADMYAYRKFHLAHHNHLNTPNDPEMAYREMGAPGWDVPCGRARVAWRFVTDLLGFGSFEILRVLHFFHPRTIRAALGPGLYLLIFLSISILANNLWIVIMWYVAIFTSFAAIWRIRCWLEHIASEDTHRVQLTGWLAWIIAPHNVYYHWEHHKWPGIPFYNLPRVREMVTSVPVISFADLFRYYESCAAIKSGTPIKNKAGVKLVDL